MVNSSITYCLTGGGTAGHAIPAIVIAKEILKRNSNANLIYIGAPDSIEKRLAEEIGVPFFETRIVSLERKFSLRNMIMPAIMLIGLIQAIGRLKRNRARFVLGTGGFAAWPTLTAARLLRIPYALQEQNTLPGLVIRITARGALRIFLGYEEAVKRLEKYAGKIMVTGNPVFMPENLPEKQAALNSMGLEKNAKTIFATGGSQGARTINNVVDQLKSGLVEMGYNLIWQIGKRDFEKYSIAENMKQNIYMTPFLSSDKMQAAYSAADLVISRSGAMTLTELANYGKPAILIPYPYSAEGHQEANSRAFEKAGAAKVILNKDLNAEILLNTIKEALNKENLNNMRDAMTSLAKPDAARVIVDEIERLAS